MLTDDEIDRITRDRWGTQLLGVMVQAHREYARAIEAAIAATPQGESIGALEPTPMATPKPGSWMAPEPEFRMDGYYIGFSPTGLLAVDLILSAVACAGKAYHHTESWNDDCGPYHDRLRGTSPAEWIQRAADDCAAAIRGLAPPAPAVQPSAEPITDAFIDAMMLAHDRVVDHAISVGMPDDWSFNDMRRWAFFAAAKVVNPQPSAEALRALLAECVQYVTDDGLRTAIHKAIGVGDE